MIGIGSDIGGSIRMPCFFNGIFGHKPSKGMCFAVGTIRKKHNNLSVSRGKLCIYHKDSEFCYLSDVVSNDGQFPSCTGLQNDYSGSGPMCRYAEDLLPLLKIMAGPNADKYI